MGLPTRAAGITAISDQILIQNATEQQVAQPLLPMREKETQESLKSMAPS